MRRLLPLFLWIALCGCSLYGYSRDLTVSDSSLPFPNESSVLQAAVSGKVTDETGVGMPGVNVLVQGTSNGTTTDAEGNYRLSLSADHSAGVLVFSFIGYANQAIPVNNQSVINVTM